MTRPDLIFLAAPVSWYAMSGVMKTFCDRFTDLLHGDRRPSSGLPGTRTFNTWTDSISSPEGHELTEADRSSARNFAHHVLERVT